MLKRVYVEITNVCNLSCTFCPGTRRSPAFMAPADFALVLRRLQGVTEHIYLHVMGEPLLHPELPTLLALAGEAGYKVYVTTNGTLLEERGALLLTAPAVKKVSVSLHSMEGNGVEALTDYLEAVWAFAQKAPAAGIICALRLWNLGGADRRNGEILSFLEGKLGAHPLELPQPRRGSWRLGESLYLEQAERFDWPDLAAAELDEKCGYINPENEVVIPFDYETAMSFSEGYASVVKGGKCGYINKDNEVVIPFVYDAATPFEGGEAKVKKDGRWGTILPDGSVKWI